MVTTTVSAQKSSLKKRMKPPTHWTRIWYRLPAGQLPAFQKKVNDRLIKGGQLYLRHYRNKAFTFRKRPRQSSIDTGGTTGRYSFGIYNPLFKTTKRGDTLWMRMDLSNALRGQETRQRSFETMIDGVVKRLGGQRVTTVR
jgi:hypothetical protein